MSGKKTKLTFKIKNIISTTIPALIIRHVYNDYGNDGFVAAIGNYIWSLWWRVWAWGLENPKHISSEPNTNLQANRGPMPMQSSFQATIATNRRTHSEIKLPIAVSGNPLQLVVVPEPPQNVGDFFRMSY